jgi:hypothetical protein
MATDFAATPSDPVETQVRQGLAWLRANLLNHADQALGQALAVQPDHRVARRLRGIVAFRLGRRDEGLADLTAAAQADAGNPRAWSDLAVALRDAGRQADAEAAYGRALASQTADAAGGAPPLEAQVFCTELGQHTVKVVDYPYTAEIRYGAGRPAHPELAAIIGAGRDPYQAFLTRLGDLHEGFAAIPLGGAYGTPEPFWYNAWFPPLDGMALTGMLHVHNPARMIEIGSGVSTKFARRAIRTYGLRTHLTSIDPQPRNEIDALCDRVIRQPLERCDPALFQTLEAGDIFFLDSSHRSFQGSDVTVFFLEILPRLKPGVIVHIHDIYLPDDYISGHVHRLWNEQYLLATALLFGAGQFEILFPSWFVGRDPELSAHAGRMLRRGPLEGADLYGASFWMRKTA